MNITNNIINIEQTAVDLEVSQCQNTVQRKRGGATRCEKRQIHVTLHRYIPYIHTILNRIDINNIQISFQEGKCIQKSSKK